MSLKSIAVVLLATAATLYGAAANTATPEENRQVIVDYYAAYATGDMSQVVEFFADDIEWHIPGHHPLAGTKRGREEVAAFFEQLGRSGFQAEVMALMADEYWVVDMHRGWSSREDGASLDTVWVLAFRIEDGKIAEARNFAFDQAAADTFFWQVYPLRPIPERLAE